MNKDTYTLLVTNSCNFNCSFCATRKLKIKTYEHVSNKLRQFFIDNKIKNLVISGGEPLMAPVSYLQEILELMKEINNNEDFEINIISNLVLWYKDPKKYDFLFKNKNVQVDTSFQYGGERKDEKDYSEERFVDLFNKFYERYGYKLIFNYVVNKSNEQYTLKACELAKRLGTKLSLFPQLPIGASTEFYLQPNILKLCYDAIEAGYKDQLMNLDWIKYNQCFFGTSNNCENGAETFYFNENGEIIKKYCYTSVISNLFLDKNEKVLFHKCYACKLKDFCNHCSIIKRFVEPFKEEHCKQMKLNLDKFIKLGIINE